MRIDWWTLALQTINLLVLVWLLHRFLFRPVADIIAARQNEARRLLEEAAAANAKADSARRLAAQETARLASARGAALAAVANEAEAEKAALMAAARSDADRLRATAQGEIERARRNEAAAAESRASRLAVDIAAKLLDRLPPLARSDGFLDGLVVATAALPETERESVRAGAPLRLRSPLPLGASERERIAERLNEAFGGPVALAFAVDPALIAGFALDAPHAVVRNNLGADLERIAAELTSANDAQP